MHPLTTDLAQQILALVKMEAYSLLGAIQDNKVVLGGSAGSDGGTGEPPAGFVGQLTQSNVTYDTAGSSRACSAGSAGSSSLVDNLDAIRLGIEICDDAIQERHIDWGHGAGQVSAVDVPFQSSSGSISATDVREAIEEAWEHGGVTGGSVVGSGVAGQVAYWMSTDTIGGDAGFTYDAATDTITLTGGITLDGAANVITIPDAFANALEIVDDTTDDEYLGFRTSAQKEVVINEDGADIDFRIEAVGVADALEVRGSDGQVALGILGAGVVQASAAGVLSSSLLAADQLDMDIGDALFNNADGLLLLGPHCEISPTEWWSLRKQLATLSGAFHQEAGRWLGTRGLVVEEATTNLILNPSIEVDTTGWTADNSTLTRDVVYQMFGDAALKVVTNDAAASEGFYDTVTAETIANTEYTFSCYLRGSGTVKLILYDVGAGIQAGDVITLTDVWTRHQITKTFGAGANRYVYLYTTAQQDITFYADGFQLEEQDYATSYVDGTLGTGYDWTGAAHGSTSTRTVTEVNLDAHVGLIASNATLSFRIVVQMPYDAVATWPNVTNYLFEGFAAGDSLIAHYRTDSNKFAMYIDGADRLLSAAQTFKAGDWIDFIVTLDFTANSYALYINGESVDTDATALAAQNVTEWNLGGSAAGAIQSGLVFSEYAVFDRVLTAIEVAGMYALQRPLVDVGSLDSPGIYILDGKFKLASPTFLIDPVAAVLGVGTSSPNAKIESLATTEQLRLSYDADSYTSFTVASDSDLTIKPAESGRVVIQPTTDSLTAFQVLDADGGTPVFNVDTTNERVGICHGAPGGKLQINQGDANGEIPTLVLTQSDTDMDFIRLFGTASVGDLTRCIVDHGDEAGSAAAVWLKVYVVDYGEQVADQAYHVLGYILS